MTKLVIPELTNGTHAVTGGRVREGKTLPGVIRCGQGFNRRRPQGRRIEDASARPPHPKILCMRVGGLVLLLVLVQDFCAGGVAQGVAIEGGGWF